MGLTLQQDPKLFGLAFKKGSKLFDLLLQSDPLKLGPDKFNIIINIKKIIIFCYYYYYYYYY